MAPVAKSVLNNITSIAYLHCLLRFLSGLVCWFQNSLHVPCRRVSTYTASMTISKTERSRVRNIYWNTVTPAFPLARHTFMGTPFPCNNIYGNGVPMRSRSTPASNTCLCHRIHWTVYLVWLIFYCACSGMFLMCATDAYFLCYVLCSTLYNLTLFYAAILIHLLTYSTVLLIKTPKTIKKGKVTRIKKNEETYNVLCFRPSSPPFH